MSSVRYGILSDVKDAHHDGRYVKAGRGIGKSRSGGSVGFELVNHSLTLFERRFIPLSVKRYYEL